MVVEQRTLQQPAASSLIKQLIKDVSELLVQHIELFRQEIKEDAQIAAKITSVAIIGALIAFTSLIFFGFFYNIPYSSVSAVMVILADCYCFILCNGWYSDLCG